MMTYSPVMMRKNREALMKKKQQGYPLVAVEKFLATFFEDEAPADNPQYLELFYYLQSLYIK